MEVYGIDKNFNKHSIFGKIYPVNSIYTSVDSTNPKELFGGNWELVEKNHPTYTIVASEIKEGLGTAYIDLISWSQIVMAFQNEYNIEPTMQDLDENGNNNTVFVDVSNGHVEAAYIKMFNISWAHRNNNERVVVVELNQNANVGQRVRINYKMSFVDKTVTYYKWKRVS